MTAFRFSAPQRGFQLSLTVPAERRFMPMAQNWARQLMALVGLGDEDGLSLELAVEEGFANAIDHAYPDGSKGPVHLLASVDGYELVVSVRDEGVPFDPGVLSDHRQSADAFSRMGLRLISHAVDELRFVNLGREGKELRMTCNLATAVESAWDSGPPPESGPAPPQSYEVRLLGPEQAWQVAKVFWLAYGYSYKNESFYHAEGLLRLVGSGKLISLVAVSEQGEVVGHAGLLRPDATSTAEAALMVVAPAHRGRGLMAELTGALLAEARTLGLRGLYSNPVTSHTLSQKETLRLGALPCGIELAACPPRQFKGLESAGVTPQRESYLNCFLPLQAPIAVSAAVPKRHRALVSEVYQAFGRPVAFLEEQPSDEPGVFEVSFDRGQARGAVKVSVAHAGRWPEMARSIDDLIHIGQAEVVDLELPLAQPATLTLWRLAEELGFLFTGLRPHQSESGDSVRLQRLACPFDLERVQIFGDLGQRWKAHLQQQLQGEGSRTVPRSSG